MSFHRPLETDGTPAPSPRWEELDNMARNLARRPAVVARFDFDQFTAIINITIDYAGWCDFAERVDLTGTRTMAAWYKWLDRFLNDGDAKDLADTQADCLT